MPVPLGRGVMEPLAKERLKSHVVLSSARAPIFPIPFNWPWRSICLSMRAAGERLVPGQPDIRGAFLDVSNGIAASKSEFTESFSNVMVRFGNTFLSSPSRGISMKPPRVTAAFDCVVSFHFSIGRRTTVSSKIIFPEFTCTGYGNFEQITFASRRVTSPVVFTLAPPLMARCTCRSTPHLPPN